MGLTRGWLPYFEGITVTRVARGLYGRPGMSPPALLLAAARAPRGVLCLESALAVHGVMEAPARTWMAIGYRDHATSIPDPPIRFVRLAPRLLTLDVEERSYRGWNVRVYSLKRTLIDCLRHRKRLGREWLIRTWGPILARQQWTSLEPFARERRAAGALRTFLAQLPSWTFSASRTSG